MSVVARPPQAPRTPSGSRAGTTAAQQPEGIE